MHHVVIVTLANLVRLSVDWCGICFDRGCTINWLGYKAQLSSIYRVFNTLLKVRESKRERERKNNEPKKLLNDSVHNFSQYLKGSSPKSLGEKGIVQK